MAALEFALDPADVPLLIRWPGISAGRFVATAMTWHDTTDGALAAKDLALCAAPGAWRLFPLRPANAATPPVLLEDARRPELMAHPLPPGLGPVASWTGRRRVYAWVEGDEAVEIHLLDGRVGATALCRITLVGAAPAVTALATALAGTLRVSVPLAGLAEQALGAATGRMPPPRALGAPEVPDGQTVGESLAIITGHLLDVMLHWASEAPTARTPEPVHQMRVATRRLRSALSVYRHAAACPAIAGLMAPLKLCAGRLGIARDWDVFLDGTGARLMQAFPDDRRCAAMMRAGARRRRAAYAELRGFLDSGDFRSLAAALACAAALRPWDGVSPGEGLAEDTAVFAAAILDKRMRRVRKAGRGIETLPVPALHELRKDCKRLRYAAEFFASLFPAKRTKRFLGKLSALQEELGLLNDTAAVSGLMAQLGRMERSYAAGLVEGFSAAHAGPARARIEQGWKRFRATRAFWAH